MVMVIIVSLWGKRNEELWTKVKELYPTMTAKEISQLTGIPSSSIWRIARSLGVSHNEATLKLLNKQRSKNLKDGSKRVYTLEEKEKRSKSQKKLWALEKTRVIYGMKQKTKHNIILVPRRTMQAIHNLCVRRKYFYTDSNSLTLYYDSLTDRSIDEQYYINKYGLKFKEA